MDGKKVTQQAMDRKKQKTVTTPVWRPVSTQSSSYEGEIPEVRDSIEASYNHSF
ncbi:unnamed protein product [Ilex paraguariensis]|uniref:Uncharacterized protein n=1 Tax=Ilex paraguariensis TaxID=185542 RepID=A0ABC8SWD9_9AQUA